MNRSSAKTFRIAGAHLTRIFPRTVTPDAVSALLSELASAEPYSDDDWATGSFDFDTFDLGINIRLEGRSVGKRERDRISTVIQVLPELQSSVTDGVDGAGTDDDHGLAWIDVDVDGEGVVDLCFIGISYNTQWNSRFKVAQDGAWTR